MTDTLNSAVFAPHLHSAFQICGQPITLELVKVDDTSSAQFEQFSLLFRGPIEPFLPQGIHELEHLQLGKLALFLVPTGPDPARTGMNYQAVFNRFRE